MLNIHVHSDDLPNDGTNIYNYMRFQNRNGAWSEWEPLASTKDWILEGTPGNKVVLGEFKNRTTSLNLNDGITLMKVPTPVLNVVNGTTFLDLTWDVAPIPDIAGYNIYRSLLPGQDYEKINPQLITVKNYRDLDIIQDVLYYYVITVTTSKLGEVLESDYSNEVYGVTNIPQSVLEKKIVTFTGMESGTQVFWTSGKMYNERGIFNIEGSLVEGLPVIVGSPFTKSAFVQQKVSEVVEEEGSED